MIYLDNAATTNYKPQCVIDAVTECLTKYPFNPNRSGTKLAAQLQEKLYGTRRKISLLYNNDGERRVIFTHGCTDALNLAIMGTARRGHIIITATEHNSVTRCVMQLKKRGFAEVTIINPDENGAIQPEEIEKNIRKNTYLICVSHASNVTGKSQQIADIGKIARTNNLLLLVDAAQSAGYFPLDMTRCNVDMLAFGAHKGLHAMQGAGALVFNGRVKIKPVVFGGTGTESNLYYQPSTVPEGLEAGTLPTPSIMAMSAGIDFWLNNWQMNSENIASKQNLLLKGLSLIPNITQYSRPNKSGIVAFNIAGYDSAYIADVLAEKFDIATRGGLQCAPLMHKYLNTLSQGVIRASVSCVTTDEECYSLLNAVERIAKGKINL